MRSLPPQTKNPRYGPGRYFCYLLLILVVLGVIIKLFYVDISDKIRVDTRAKISMFPSSSRPSFLCGVAKLHRMSSVNNDKHRARFFEWSPTKSSISHRNDDVTKMVSLRQPVSSGRCELRGSQLTLRDVLNSKRVCACPSERFIGIQDRCMELDWGVVRKRHIFDVVFSW